MRKRHWLVMGVAGLALLLAGGAAPLARASRAGGGAGPAVPTPTTTPPLPTSTFTRTTTPAPTACPGCPTATRTYTPTPIPSATRTNTPTITRTPTITSTPSNTRTRTPTATGTPPTATPTPVCPPVWTVVPSPNQATNSALEAVAVVAPDDIWAVGYAGGGLQSLALHWDGTTWSTVPSPASGEMYSLAALNSNDIWAVGTLFSGGSHTVTEHWNGSSWSVVPSPNPGGFNGSSLRAVAALAPDNVWAVGTTSANFPQTLVEHWDGSQWSVVPSPNLGTQGNALWGVAALAADDIWAVGTYDAANGPSQLQTLVEHWDGTAWSVVPSPNYGANFNELKAVAAVGPDDIWAVGYWCLFPGACAGTQMLAEHWDGSAWEIVSTPQVGSADYASGVAARASNDVWAAGFYSASTNQTFIEHWDGASWSLVPSPNVGTGSNLLRAVAAAPNGDAWAVGGFQSGLGQPLTLRYAIPCPATATPTVTGTPPTATNTRTPTNSPTATNSPTHTPSPSPTPTGTPPTATATRTPTFGIPPTATAIPPTYTPAPPPGTPTSTVTGTPPTRTPTHIPTPTYTPAPPTGTPLPTQTPGGPTATPPPTDTPPAPTTTPGVPVPTSTTPPTGTRAPTHTPATPSPTPTPQSLTPTSCTRSFSDVHPADYFYTPVLALACRGVISGYADGSFRPYNQTTRAQMVKIVVLGFGRPLTTPPAGARTFADVPSSQPFFAVIETAAAGGIVSGYLCGGPGEPCDGQGRPYFRPGANVTRAQLAKITVATAGWSLVQPATATFADVAPGSVFYPFVETAACHGLVSGYACGGPGEPCDPSRQPYFRQYRPATRGQIAKIVYGALGAGQGCPP